MYSYTAGKTVRHLGFLEDEDDFDPRRVDDCPPILVPDVVESTVVLRFDE